MSNDDRVIQTNSTLPSFKSLRKTTSQRTTLVSICSLCIIILSLSCSPHDNGGCVDAFLYPIAPSFSKHEMMSGRRHQQRQLQPSSSSNRFSVPNQRQQNDVASFTTLKLFENSESSTTPKSPLFHTTSSIPNNESPSDTLSNFIHKTKDESSSTRRIFMGLTLLTAGTAIATHPSHATTTTPIDLEDELTTAKASLKTSQLKWQTSPINKRSGVTVFEAEKSGYNVRFVTYLSRFLLNFDGDCQKWWYAKATEIPRRSTSDEVDALRIKQFAAFSASVEVGLQEFQGPNGPKRLMNAMLERYCPDPETVKQFGVVEQNLPPLSPTAEAKLKREIKEARRQIALLFGLMDAYQPVEEITMLLAAIDNAAVTFVAVNDGGSGYAPGYDLPGVVFPPPVAGEGYERAVGRANLRPSGRILRVDLTERGSGYTKPPAVVIAPPVGANETDASSNDEYRAATAKATVFQSGPNKGRIDKLQLLDPGSGYTEDELPIAVEISPPQSSSSDGIQAIATPVLEYEVASIEILDGGSGYAAEKTLVVEIEPPPVTSRIDVNDTLAYDEFSSQTKSPNAVRDKPAMATAYPRAEKDSYYSFRSPDDDTRLRDIEALITKRDPPDDILPPIGGTTSGIYSSAPSLPYWSGGASSSLQLLSLLPAGYGLEYDIRLKRYTLAIGQGFETLSKNWMQGASKPLDPEFGPRGRSPIEREKLLDAGTVLRFCASGAICSAGSHLVLTPIDVVKTKIQTDPQNYPGVIAAFQKVLRTEGPSTFFTGWQPTFVGFFTWGAVSYSLTEFFRRYLIDIAGADAVRLEVPIIFVAAAAAAVFGAVVISPFEAVRIRSVAQPDYAENILGVYKRIVKEEGPKSLFTAVPVFIFKEVPFGMAKFTVFNLSSNFLYDTYPAAREDIQLSLLISLVSGVLGGIAAGIVSNPADATVSEMKRVKTDLSPLDAAKQLLARGGIPSLFRGLRLRLLFYSFLVSIQFFVYDAVRFNLGIGSDDLKLYLDVLGGALRESGGPL